MFSGWMMLRQFYCMLLCSLVSAPAAFGQAWARDMFTETSHDFGRVTRGAQPNFRFEFKNKYKEDVHVAAVRSSCGCTTPTIEKETIKSGETSAILAMFNTTAFTGQKSAVLTVVFDRPYYAELQLTVRGEIRTDIELQPAELDFGRFTQGDEKEQVVLVSFKGRPDLAITDVRSPFEHVAVKLGPPERQPGTVNYRMVVRLKDTVPEGLLQQQLAIIIGKDDSAPVTLPLKGEVVSPLVFSPASLSFSSVKAGTEAKKVLLLKGPAPFMITKIDSGDPRVTVEIPQEKKIFHKLEVVFKGEGDGGPYRKNLQIDTDLAGGRSASCLVIADVTP
jgi:hypothetical protein